MAGAWLQERAFIGMCLLEYSVVCTDEMVGTTWQDEKNCLTHPKFPLLPKIGLANM